MNRAYSTFAIKSFDESSGEFEGVASTPTTDRMGDIVESKGAKFTLPMPLLWQHRSSEPIGLVTRAKVTADGITVSGKVMKDLLPRIGEAWTLIRAGLVRGLSVGFSPLEMEPIDKNVPWGAQRFTAWDWLELSAVTIPANADANIQTIKAIDTASRAALGAQAGNGDRSGNPPGASGPSTGTPKGHPMKSFPTQLKELNDARAIKTARIKELAEGCGGDVGSLDAAELSEYDALLLDVKTIDASATRVKGTMQAIEGAVEVPHDAGTDPEKGTKARGTVYREAKAPPLEKGIALAQYLRLMGRAKGNVMHAYHMAQGNNGLDKRVVAMIKGAVEGGSVSGTTTAGNWGMELVGSETSAFADFADFLRPTTILGKFGTGGVPALNTVPFRVPLIGMTSGGAAQWVGEGKAKPLTKFAFSRNHLEPLKIAAMCVVTMELVEDSSPSADGLLRNALAAAIREEQDISFIDPGNGGSAGVKPASITDSITPIPAQGTGDADDVRTDVKAAFGAFIAANNAPTNGVWIMSSRTALSLSLMTNALGQPEDFSRNLTMNGGSFAGLPVITSEYVPDDSNGGTVVLVNASDIFYGDTGGLRVDTSMHASILMDDAPTGMNSTDPADSELVSMYQTNSIAYRAERRLDWMRRRESAVVVLSGVNWGAA